MSESLTFSSPNEELNYLRSKVLEAERKLEAEGLNKPRTEVIKESIKSFATEAENREKVAVQAGIDAEALMLEHREVELGEMVSIAEQKGVLHSLKIVEKLRGWRLEDDFHDYLTSLVSQGLPPIGMKEKGPVFQALHMSLYEVILPKEDKADKPLGEVVKSMEQLYAGLLSVASESPTETDYMAIEIANPNGEEDTHAFVAVPNSRKELFSRQLLALFPNAKLMPREHDYNIFNEFGTTIGASAYLSSSPAYPLKTSEHLGEDPLNVILKGFSKIPKHNAGAALQIIFRPRGNSYTNKYSKALSQIEKGKKPKDVLEEMTIKKEVMKAFATMLIGKKESKQEEKVDEKVVEAIREKISSPIVETNIRLVVSAASERESNDLLHNLESGFNQFENPGHNSIKWAENKTWKESDFYRAFTFRLYREGEAMPLNLRELSTILHFQTEALHGGSNLKQTTSRSSTPPLNISDEGTLLGVNRYQGTEKKIYISKDDRLRHFYTIGQTGTGKSTLLKNMVMDDIRSGEGVCMIDPHGSDILEVLANVPPERAGDVIYFDPADVEKPLGLNMLEYHKTRPEEKTFVVNELFSIFQKLYGKVPESMGPMFEQYFRNSALLAIDDPNDNATLLDVSRILSNKEYRREKLSKTTNPVLLQFWQEIAEKAGGEAALANIVPYITSKFDVFLANDIMRPIVAAPQSAFDLRDIMDNKKILLVNLSKGRLGDINANLLGLIIVGKILLAALSRVDSAGKDLPPFYLYIDEFQNITTNSIATILSEARKYKLSLNIAHQFIAQLEEDIKNAVFGNVGSICAFRVGADDAKYLESQFAPIFNADDLMNVDNRKAYLKLLVNGRPAEPFDIETIASPKGDPSIAEEIIRYSRTQYGRSREEVESEIREKYIKKEPSPVLESVSK